MNIHFQVGANVRRLRNAKGWSQEQLAFECDLDRTYISGVERGVRNPTLSILERVAKALGVNIEALVKVSGE